MRTVSVVAVVLALGACEGPVDPNGGAAGPARVDALATGYAHACLLDADGVAWCWGAGSGGQLGRTIAGEHTEDPGQVSGGHRFVRIAAGGMVTCAITREAEVYCWGWNGDGELGRASPVQSAEPLAVELPEPAVDIAVGFRSVCALGGSGQAYCWGSNADGQGGIGAATEADIPPTAVVGGLVFESITAGLRWACGLTPEGQAYCWGGGMFGALGTGDIQSYPAPTAVAGAHTFDSLVTGATTTCGITTEGETLCWGSNYYGTNGSGTTERNTVLEPANIDSDPGFVWAGSGHENNILTVSCGLTAGGAAYCWGPNTLGGLGTDAELTMCDALSPNGDPFGCTGTPVPVQGGLTFSVIRPSNGFVCGITTDGVAYCWGAAGEGQLGTDAAAALCNPSGEPVPCTFEPLAVELEAPLP